MIISRPELSLSDTAQGPKQFICFLTDVTAEARVATQERWQNISAFAAILTVHQAKGLLPQSMDFRRPAYNSLARALEYELTGEEYLDKEGLLRNPVS